MSATISRLLMAGVWIVLFSTPRLYEQNLTSMLLLSSGWVLQEIQSFAVVRSLFLAILQGEAFHRTCLSFHIDSSNVMWITLFVLLQEDLVSVARLVTALAFVNFSFGMVWNRMLADGVSIRSRDEYWPLEVVTHDVDQDDDTEDENRRDWTSIVQLMMTKRAFDMLSNRSRCSEDLEKARRAFLVTGGSDRASRDRFTMAVFSALSKQSTASVMKSAESTNVQRIATRAAAFIEQRFTTTAINRVELLFRPLPYIDPSGLNPLQMGLLTAIVLYSHKLVFKNIKKQFFYGQSTMVVFLTKQITRFGLFMYLIVRYLMGYLKLEENLSQLIGSRRFLGHSASPLTPIRSIHNTPAQSPDSNQ